MKLKKYLEGVPGDKVIYIGAKVGFLFGGTKNEFLEALPGIDEKWEAWSNRVNDTAAERYKAILEKHGAESRHTKMAKKKQESCEKYVPLLNRDVVDVFDRTSEDARNIIVEGVEPGGIWSIKEGTAEWRKTEVEFNLDNLVGAIVKEVVDSYKETFRREVYSLTEAIAALNRWRSMSEKNEKFFRSERFRILTSVDPEYVIEETRRIVADTVRAELEGDK